MEDVDGGFQARPEIEVKVTEDITTLGMALKDVESTTDLVPVF